MRSRLIDLGELTPDKPLANFFGATSDVVKLGITPVAPAWVFVDVAIAAKKLNTLLCYVYSNS